MSRKRLFILLTAVVLLGGYTVYSVTIPAVKKKISEPVDEDNIRTAIFAGGCFWCMEPPFEKLKGVVKVESGYTGGHKENPTYEEVCNETTGHVEAIQITYDATRIGYMDLLEVFWRNVDPTDAGGQFVDRGESYISVVFVANDEQRTAAEQSLSTLEKSKRFDKPIITPILNASRFYLAEEYHQDFYIKSALKYKYYRYQSGRDAFIDKIWGTERDFIPQYQDIKK